MNVDFQGIEDLFLELMNSLSGIFSQLEIQEVQDFVDVGEYGLALETLVDVINEEDKRISDEILAPIQKLASEMLINQEVLLGKLQGHIINKGSC